jgi:hypothetical protein
MSLSSDKFTKAKIEKYEIPSWLVTLYKSQDFKLEIGGQSLWESFMDFQSFYMTWMEEICDFEFKSGLVQPK